MSKSHTITVECPHCHTKTDVKIWDSINVDLNPELREKIFSYEFFLHECEHCRKVTPLRYNTIYHDMKHKFMLFFVFLEEDEEFCNGIQNMENQFGRVMKGYTFRVVYGLLEFMEKILILEHGLNDIAVERQKFCISHLIHPTIAEKGYELHFKGLEEADDKSPYGYIVYIYRDTEDDKMYTARFPMEEYYEQVLACNVDPRMKVDGCTCVNQDWMNRQMRKE